MSARESGFYKREGPELHHGPNRVDGPNGLRLRRRDRGTYSYPVRGWTWYESEAAARSDLGLPPVEVVTAEMVMDAGGEFGRLLHQYIHDNPDAPEPVALHVGPDHVHESEDGAAARPWWHWLLRWRLGA